MHESFRVAVDSTEEIKKSRNESIGGFVLGDPGWMRWDEFLIYVIIWVLRQPSWSFTH